MKILVTGFTALQCGSENRQIYKIDVPAEFVKTLRSYGHDVEWRKVELSEEDFSMYDKAIICVGPITSSNCSKGLGALKALSRIKECVVFYDDWKLKEIHGSWKAVLKIGKKQFHKKWGNGMSFYQNTEEDIEKNEEELLSIINELATTGRKEWKVLCPMFEWGNKEIIFEQKNIAYLTKDNFNFIDPTSAVIDINIVTEDTKKRNEWCIASIADHTPWIKKQHLKWDVKYYGCRKLKCERLKTEEDVFNKYKESYGVLSPEYPQSGSGWFRARYIYAALAGSILWCGKKDAKALGIAYEMEPQLVEIHSEEELRELNRKQYETIIVHVKDKGYFDHKLLNIIEGGDKHG